MPDARPLRPGAVGAVGTVLALALAGCGGGAEASREGTVAAQAGVGVQAGGAGPVEVVASFYPLVWVTEQVGGDAVDVTSLTPPGADGHDVELSPSQVGGLAEVDLVVHVSGGLQPATDEALQVSPPRLLVDAADVVDLVPTGGEDGPADPHFWLDPGLVADVGDAVARALAEADPDRSARWAAGAADLRERLLVLDDDITTALAPCEGAALVVSHEAFGYLTDRHGIEQVGLTGIDPEVPPSPARLRRAVAVVEGRDVDTVFFERSAGPRVTEALAGDLGLDTAVLDPLEAEPAAGEDYESVMRANLAAMRSGLACGAP